MPQETGEAGSFPVSGAAVCMTGADVAEDEGRTAGEAALAQHADAPGTPAD